MTDQALQLAFELACRGRDLAEAKNRELEETIQVLCESKAELREENAALRLDNTQLMARLRVVELMEEQAANRLGFQIPVRLVEGDEAHSLKVAH